MSDELPMPGLPERGESLPSNRKSTGDHWAKHHPELALRAEKMWSEDDLHISAIADALGASRNTIRAYLEGRGLLDVEHESIKRRGHLAASLMINRIIDDPDGVPNSNVALTAKLMVDAAGSVSGAPTHIIEHRHEHTIKIPSEQDIRRFREAAQTGFGTEKMAHRGPAAAGGQAAGALTEGPPPLVLDVPTEVVTVAGNHQQHA